MNREEYKQLLVDKGYDEEIINELLQEYDINLGKITGATTVGANAAPDITAPEDTGSTSEISLSDYPSLATTVKKDRKVPRGDEFGTIDTITEDVPTDFYTELSKTLDEKVVDKYLKGKTKEEARQVDTDEVLNDVFNNIQSQYIANDPFIKAKNKQYTALIQPQIDALKDKYSKLAKESSTSELSFENEFNLAELDKKFQEEYKELYAGFNDDVDVQKRLQAYVSVANKYSTDVSRKLGRNKDAIFRAIDVDIPIISDLGEGIYQGSMNAAQGFSGVELQMQQKGIQEASRELERLGKLNPEDESIWITNIVPKETEFDKPKIEKQTGTVAENIKFQEEKIKKATEKFEKTLLPYLKRQDDLQLFNPTDFSDGVSFGEAFRTLGQSLPYMGMAVVPYVGIPLVSATMYGQARRDILANQMSDKYKIPVEDLTAKDYIKFAKEEEENVNEFYVAAGAVAAGYLERIGASRVMKGVGKAMGVGDDVKQVFGSLLKGHYNRVAKSAVQQGKNMNFSGLIELGTEVGQETVLGLSQFMSDKNDESGTFLNNRYVKADQLFQAGAGGYIVGAMLPGIGGIGKQSIIELRQAARNFSTKFDISNNYAVSNEFFGSIRAEIQKRYNNGNLNSDNYKAEMDYLESLEAAGRTFRLNPDLKAKDKNKIFNNMLKKDDLVRRINTEQKRDVPNDVLIEKLKKQAALLNIDTENILGIDFVEKASKQLMAAGVINKDTTVEGTTTEELIAKGYDKKEIGDGVFDPETNTLFVNRDSDKKGIVTTAQHEFLHPLTKAMIASGKIDAMTIKNMVNKYDTNGYVQSRIKDEPQTYTPAYMEKNPDEYMALFGEGVLEGEIDIENNPNTALNFFKKLFNTGGIKGEIDFGTTEGLKNFVVEYAKSNKKGKLTDKLTSSLKGVTPAKGGDIALSSRLQPRLESEFNGNARSMLNQTLSSTPDGRVVDGMTVPFTESDFGQEIGGVVENQTQRLFDKIPQDLTRVLNEDRFKARQMFKDQMVMEAAAILQNEWDPSKQRSQSLDSWLTQLMVQRSQSLAKRMGIQDTFASETTGQEVDTSEETVQVDTEFVNIREGAFQIETGSPQYEKIINKVKDIITRKKLVKRSGKEVVLDFNNKNLRKDLNEIFQKEIRKILISEGLIPKNVDDYKAWLGKNKKRIWSKLSQDVINKRFKDLTTKVVDRQTRKQSKLNLNIKNLNAGNALFVKDNIDTDAFVKYFEGRARKESLGQALAIELANDATLQVMGDPDVLLKRDEKGLNKGTMQNESAVQAMAKVVQRPVDLVFSKRAAKLSQSTDPEAVKDYNEIRKILISKDFIDDLKMYASEPAGSKFNGIHRILQHHLRKAKDEGKITTVKIGELTAIGNEFVPKFIKTNFAHNLDVKNIAEKTANYLLANHDLNRDVISIKYGGLDGNNGFDKSDINLINNARLGYKDFKDAVEQGFIMDGDTKIPLPLDPANLSIVINHSWQPDSIGGFILTKDPAGIRIKQSEVKPHPKGSRTSTFRSINDFNKNVGEFKVTQNKGVTLGKKDPYLKDTNQNINPSDYNGIRTEGLKYKQILKDTIETYRILNQYGYITNKQMRVHIEALFQDTGGLGRKAAELTLIPTVRKDVMSKLLGIDPNDVFVFEHMIPANVVANLAYEYIISGSAKSKKNLDAELKNYKGAIIPKAIDDIIKDRGQQSNMGVRHEFGKDPLDTRYKEVMSFMELHDLENGGTVGSNNFVYSKRSKEALIDKAIEMARRTDAPKKGITVMDFDDTIAKTKSMIGVTTKDGKFIKIDATQFALQSAALEEQGAIFDFSEFNEVKKGQKGPLFDVIKKRVEKFGNKDVFILTARPQAAAPAIKKFLSDNGVDIPLENITGLENGTPEAKADFMIAKAADGYNDFYFADDAIKNVKAVKDVLDIVDVKSDIQQAREDVVYSKRGKKSQRFNEILEETKGIRAETTYSDAAGKARGDGTGNWNIFIEPSAEDFGGLLLQFAGKGKQGEAHKEFFEETLLKPITRGIDAINRAKQQIRNDYEALKQEMPSIHKMLRNDTGYNKFTYDTAIRVYLWNKNGMEIPGLSKTDVKKLTAIVKGDPDMEAFANKISAISKLDEGYVKPDDIWLTSSIGLDLTAINQLGKRSDYLKEFVENKNEIFSPENLNKVQAVYGTDFREALEDLIYRIEKGSNRTFGQNKAVNKWMDWINNATGTIMFLNTRSAVMQTISFTNFINYSDNNIFAAGKAFANQTQFWEDFGMIFNSDFLKQRRGGMTQDVNWQEISEQVKGHKDPVRKAIAVLLQKGFVFTQMADSFAIALGGSTMYRNRTEAYMKNKNMSREAAEEQAFLDFQVIAETTQQSGRPDLISKQQAGPLGRVILAFQNVTMQYNRFSKKEILDFAKGRRVKDPVTGGYHTLAKSRMIQLSRVTYYVGMQNLVFNAMQNAIFALAFDDDEKDEKAKEKYNNIANGMADSVLRGMGIKGAIVAMLKNTIMEFKKQSDKPSNRADYGYVLVEAFNISPPIGSKARKTYSALQTYKFNKKEMMQMGLDIDNPAIEASSNLISAATNVPTDRVYYKIQSTREVLNNEHEAWQRMAVALGWRTWQVGIEDDEPSKKPKPDPRLKEKNKVRSRQLTNPRKIK
jgi:hypothetical protein